MLELKGINIRDGIKYRLSDINLSIRYGEKIALLGQSGAGKSSLIKVANGTLSPSHGSVKWHGVNIKDISRRKRVRIGTLWQDLRLIEELTVAQNVNTGALGKHGLIWAMKNLMGIIDQNKALLCLEACNFPRELSNAFLKDLSGGQLQRVAIARLLCQEAELNLIDEPLANLDPKLSIKILNLLLNNMKFSGMNISKTCLISIHRPDMIANFTRVIGLREGKIEFDLGIKEVNSMLINDLYR